MTAGKSVRQRKITSNIDEDQDFFDSLIRVSRTAYSPGPTGTRVHLSLARSKVMRGGLGSGKSRCGTEHLNDLALRYPGSSHVIARKDLVSLKETTQKEFLEKVVDAATIETFNVNDNKLYYKNGSEVLFRETKDPDKFKSLEITSYLIDECDENPTPEAYEKLDERLRQKLMIDGQEVIPPYCGMLIFNPTNEEHWLYGVANSKLPSVEDFRFDTYENTKNLPPDYIPNLIQRLSKEPWEINRLIHGHWGRTIKGKPVIVGFLRDKHVRPVTAMPHLPLYRGWDFGFNHPAVVFAQIDPVTGRVFVLREFLGEQHPLQDEPGRPGVASVVKELTGSLVGLGHPVFDFGDPHGADKKDTGLSSIEYLRIHHSIRVAYQRSKILTGLDEIQHKVVTEQKIPTEGQMYTELPLLVIDPSCQNLIAGFEGGYQRDPEDDNKPLKDGLYDHLFDAFRYLIVNTMNPVLRSRRQAKSYTPRNKYTGY